MWPKQSVCPHIESKGNGRYGTIYVNKEKEGNNSITMRLQGQDLTPGLQSDVLKNERRAKH